MMNKKTGSRAAGLMFSCKELTVIVAAVMFACAYSANAQAVTED